MKSGKKSGYIEIELKGLPHKNNIVIRRTLNAHSKSSQFFINGKAASGREVNSKIQELNIQVSNLWSAHIDEDRVFGSFLTTSLQFIPSPGQGGRVC